MPQPRSILNVFKAYEIRKMKGNTNMNKLKEKLLRGEKALGTHIQLNDNITTEIIGSLGFDYLWIDTEHTTISLAQVEQHLLAARSVGVSAIVRVPSNDPIKIKPILEMGPDGVIIPMVNSYEEAMRAVQSCLYPPRGYRGYGPRRASFYGTIPMEEYIRNIENNIMRIIQIEHIDAVRDLKRIVTIDEIDAYIIGPMDLSASVGKLGQLDDPEVCALFDEIIETIHAAGKPVGVSNGFVPDEIIAEWRDRGVDMISLASETDFIINQAKLLMESMKRVMLQ
ncbi:MAG: HpcH/HpaI aldolase family protein [Eubacteriales bacterium]